MIDPQSQDQLKQAVSERMKDDRKLLDQLRSEIRPLRYEVRKIQPRTTTAVSFVAADGGNNRIQFDPFLVQIVRVVDSSNNELCLEVISPTTDVIELSSKQFNSNGTPRTPLGEMMAYLGVSDLTKLSHMIRVTDSNHPVSPTWVQVYRELVEWAVLFSIIKKDFGSDTIIICDGLLRSKAFAGDLFKRLREGISEEIQRKYEKSRRKIYLAGVAKHTQVLTRYRLAMVLERILTVDYSAFAEVSRDIERNALIWPEYARDDDQDGVGEVNKFVSGKMFLVKFGTSTRDPIWPVDVFLPQVGEAQAILGYMLSDAVNGFPVPLYPHCLQKAHENAALVDFDFDIIQDLVIDGLRDALTKEAPEFDAFMLQDADPSRLRYG